MGPTVQENKIFVKIENGEHVLYWVTPFCTYKYIRRIGEWKRIDKIIDYSEGF